MLSVRIQARLVPRYDFSMQFLSLSKSFVLILLFFKLSKRLAYFFGDNFFRFFSSSKFEAYRFVRLKDWAMRSYQKGDYDTAIDLANELIVLSDNYRASWNYGNAVHWAYTIKGLVAYEREEYEVAKQELIRSARVVSSPQLESFGPMMILAEKCRIKYGDKLVNDYRKIFFKSIKKNKCRSKR